MQFFITNKVRVSRIALAIFAFVVLVAEMAQAQSPTCNALDIVNDAIDKGMILSEQVVRQNALPAPEASRLYALNSIALHDAYKIGHAQAGYLLSLPHRHHNINNIAQVQLNASLTLLELQYPYSKTIVDNFKNEICMPQNTAEALLGRDIGEHISEQSPPPAKAKFFEETTQENGVWRSTPPYYHPPVLPLWAIATPFELKSRGQFRPSGPPALESQSYKTSLEAVKKLGSYESALRSKEQSDIALFWADDRGTSSGPGHWNAILRDLDIRSPSEEKLKTLLLLNIAMYDAGIAAWEAKYSYKFWRPLTAIKHANGEKDFSQGKMKTWRPFIENPSHPEYVSGHSTFSAAAATILTQRLGDIPFCTSSEGLPNQKRCYTNASAAAREAGMSRIYGGIHFSFSNEDGLELGAQVAGWVLTSFDRYYVQN